jgi:hypothetical protein
MVSPGGIPVPEITDPTSAEVKFPAERLTFGLVAFKVPVTLRCGSTPHALVPLLQNSVTGDPQAGWPALIVAIDLGVPIALEVIGT